MFRNEKPKIAAIPKLQCDMIGLKSSDWMKIQIKKTSRMIYTGFHNKQEHEGLFWLII